MHEGSSLSRASGSTRLGYASSAAAALGAGERVLVVDDEPDITALVAYHLAKNGFRVSTAVNGPDALRAVSDEAPSLIVLDRMLPGMSGDEVLATVRANAASREIPVLMLTAKREEHDRVRGLVLGADDYLTKPYPARDLLSAIESLLGGPPA